METLKRTPVKALLVALAMAITQTTMSLPGLADIYKGAITTSISTKPNTVRVAGMDIFNIQAAAGGFSAHQRTVIVERNIDNALMSTTDYSPAAVEIVTINNLPVVRLAGKHIVTADSRSASLSGMSMVELAESWATNMRRALEDSSRVSKYVAELGGSFISSVSSLQTRRPQHEAGRLNRAADTFTLVPADLKTSDSFQKLGNQNLLDRNYADAAANFKQSLAMDSDNAMSHYGLGVAKLKLGQVDTAINELQMARWLDHDNAFVHIALGEAFQAQGHAIDAIKQYKEAILLQPENPEPYLLIADIREQRNDLSESVDELTSGVMTNPNSEFLRLKRQDQMVWRLIRPY